MSHDHSHHHHGPVELKNVNSAFIIGISLNFLFVLIEVIAGIRIHSLSLLSDAGHNLADVGALALSLLAFRLLKVRSSDKYTYGYRKTSILVALFNAMVLLVSIGAITYEAVHRLFQPQPLPGGTIAIVAGIGIIINVASALMFLRDKAKDINIRSSYLHLMSDAFVSLGLVVGGIIIHYTQWYWLDPLLSIGIAITILISTWSLFRDSLKLSMDGVPDSIDLEEIKAEAKDMQGIMDMHHIHVWAISSTENAMTAHLVLEKGTSAADEIKLKHRLRHALEHKNIHHITLETENDGEPCEDVDC
jgi:cobalt-zinc-cadmium efflux system protein